MVFEVSNEVAMACYNNYSVYQNLGVVKNHVDTQEWKLIGVYEALFEILKLPLSDQQRSEINTTIDRLIQRIKHPNKEEETC